MGFFQGNGASLRAARLCALAGGCLALGHCAGGNVDSKYGVATSARVVAAGDPVPKGGGVYRVGKPYRVAGREYVPQEDTSYRAEGLASWYGSDFHGRYTANGEIYDMNSITAAHPTLPLPSYVRVTNLQNHKSLVVRVNDRGPYVGNRVIDLSARSAQLLGYYGHGLARVRVEYVGRAPLAGSDDRKLAATLRENVPDSPIRVASAGPFATEKLPAAVRAPATAKPFASEMFDARPLTRQPQRTASLPERPDRPGQRTGAVPEQAATPSTAHPGAPVSAYAPVGYDSRAGFMGGRGLY